MTSNQVAQRIADDPWVTLFARGAMIVSMALLGWINYRFDRVEMQQSKLETRLEVLEANVGNDRTNTIRLFDDAAKRLDLVFARINALPTRSDVDKDLLWRDQQLEKLDHRVGGLEDRVYGRNAHEH